MTRTALSAALYGTVLTAIAVELSTFPANADSTRRVTLPSPTTKAWRHVPLRRVARETRYRPVETETEGPAGAIRAESDCSASLLVLHLDDIDLTATPLLTWRWRVERELDIENERVASGDDFSARVYVAFAADPRGTSWWQRARARIAEAVYGEGMPGSALNYVVPSHLEPGTRWPNPHSPTSQMISLERGKAGMWRLESVDVAADYATSFGQGPPQLRGIGLMSDSDNSCQRGAASFADFAFTARPPSASRPHPR